MYSEVSSGKTEIYLESFVRIISTIEMSSTVFKLSSILTNSASPTTPCLSFPAFGSLHFVKGVNRSFDFAALPH